jgi:Ala-tRNA(Pro) deacylase
MPGKQVKEFLDSHHVKFISMAHSPAFTSQEVAASAHISGKDLAKVVVAKADGKMMLIVVPAHEHVNFGELRKIVGTTVDLASESEFKGKFPECETGAVPPFGNLYQVPVYISSELAKHNNIIFNAGTHSELMQLAYEDFAKLVEPKVIPSS